MSLGILSLAGRVANKPVAFVTLPSEGEGVVETVRPVRGEMRSVYCHVR